MDATIPKRLLYLLAAITSNSHLVISPVRELLRGGLVLNARGASGDVLQVPGQLLYVAHDAAKS